MGAKSTHTNNGLKDFQRNRARYAAATEHLPPTGRRLTDAPACDFVERRQRYPQDGYDIVRYADGAWGVDFPHQLVARFEKVSVMQFALRLAGHDPFRLPPVLAVPPVKGGGILMGKKHQ